MIMKKKILASFLALAIVIGLISPMNVSVADSQDVTLADNVTEGTYVDETADPYEAYEYTVTGDDGTVYQTTILPEGITLTEEQAAKRLDWEISAAADGNYYIKNAVTGKYLRITNGKWNATASLTEDAKVTTGISKYDGDERHAKSVKLGQSGQYLNMHGGIAGYFGGYDQDSDGGSAHYLYKKDVTETAYTVDTSELRTLINSYAAENLIAADYREASWIAYANALAAAEALLAQSNAFETLEEAVVHKTSLDEAYVAQETAHDALVPANGYTNSLETLYEAIVEANGGQSLSSEVTYDAESGTAYKEALETARQSFDTQGEAEQAVENLKNVVKNMEKVAESCFPEMNWKITADTTNNYISNLTYVNSSVYTPQTGAEVTFDAYEALIWNWSGIEKLVNDEDNKVSPVWSASNYNGMSSCEFSNASDNETWTQADVYKISGEFTWPEGYDLYDTTIVLDSVNDFYYRDIYTYIDEHEGYAEYFPMENVLPINDDVYVVVWSGEEENKPTVDTINDYLAFWSGTSGKGIWTQKGQEKDDWTRTEPATFIEWNLQGERAFRQSYPNLIGTGVNDSLTNANVEAFEADSVERHYLGHTDGWYTLTDTTSINSVLRAQYPDGIEPGTKVHIDLYVMNNSTNGVIDELEIELVKERETETDVTVEYYLNEVSEEALLGTEQLLNQAYGKEIILQPGTGAGQLNSYKAEAIFQAGYKDVTNGVQLNQLIVTEGGENIVRVLYTLKDLKTVILTAPSTTVDYDGSEHVLNTITVTENGYTAEATPLGNGEYTLPDGNTIQNVYSYISKVDPGIYANNFTLQEGTVSPAIVVKDGENNVTNTYTIIKVPGTLTITYDPEDVTRTYDFGLKNIYENVWADVETRALSKECDSSVLELTEAGVSYTPTTVNTGETIAVELTFSGDYKVTKNFTFVPASNVLYGERFVTRGETTTWVTSESAIASEITDNEVTVYGYTEDIYGESHSGNGALTSVLDIDGESGITGLTAKTDALTFKFTGTGFDLISACGPNTGILVAKVENKDTGKVQSYLVDTYFTGDEDVIVPNGDGILAYQVPVIRELGLSYGTYTVTVYGYLINTAGAISSYAMDEANAIPTEDIVMTVIDDLGLEGVDPDDMKISFMDDNSVLNGGTGNVSAAPAFGTFALRGNTVEAAEIEADTTADVYFDGFRVYQPLGENEPQIYEDDLENGTKYVSLFDFVKNSVTEFEDWIENAFVYVEYDGETSIASIEEYQIQGPQNEIYLTPGSGIAFALKNYEEGDVVQISAKSIGESEANAVAGVDTIDATSTEMYYEVLPEYDDDLEVHFVSVINNADSEGILAISGLKISSNIEPMASGALGDIFVSELETKEGAFVPNFIEVLAKPSVTLGRNTTISVQSSTVDVDYITIAVGDGASVKLTPTNKKAVDAGKATVYKYSYTFKTKGLEVGGYTLNVRAYDTSGNASEPISLKINVTE